VRKKMEHMHTEFIERDLELLKESIQIDLNLNDLRMMVNCMKAVEYQSEVDDEPYLDTDALDLKKRLEHAYERMIVALSNHKESCCS
jgi:hypothetical protein